MSIQVRRDVCVSLVVWYVSLCLSRLFPSVLCMSAVYLSVCLSLCRSALVGFVPAGQARHDPRGWLLMHYLTSSYVAQFPQPPCTTCRTRTTGFLTPFALLLIQFMTSCIAERTILVL